MAMHIDETASITVSKSDPNAWPVPMLVHEEAQPQSDECSLSNKSPPVPLERDRRAVDAVARIARQQMRIVAKYLSRQQDTRTDFDRNSEVANCVRI
jgi:hypothetical protein